MICMVANGNKSDRCRFCNSSFSEDILNKIKNDRDDVYCENCGDIIKHIQDKYNFNLAEITENDSKADISDTPAKPQKELKPHPDVLNYPIGRVFYDTDFPLVFKSNFIIVFSRLTCFHALYLEHKGQIQLNKSDIPENTLNDLYMSTRDVQDKRLAPEFLNDLHDISKEDFERNLKKMQAKIQSNRQYLEDFHVYTRWLIREVYLLISGGLNEDDLSKFELTIYKDLKNQEKFFEIKLAQLIQGPTNMETLFSYFFASRGKRDSHSRKFSPKPINNIKCRKWEELRGGEILTNERSDIEITKTETYTTLQLIEDLLKELRFFKLQLINVFPEKIKKYPHVSLSRLWKGKEESDFILNIKLRYERENSHVLIDSNDLQLLRKNLIYNYGENKLIYCFRIIEKYENREISIIDMIDELLIELGRIVVYFPVTKKILSLLFGMDEKFISNAVERRIKKKNRKDYNPNYKFSLERLEVLLINLDYILGQNSKKCFHFIREYKRLNPDLKEYSQQKYNCREPHAFNELDEDSAYWLGFFVADVFIHKYEYKIQLNLAMKDKEQLEKLAEFVKIDKKYIYEYDVYLKYKGEIKKYRVARLSFGCKSMVQDLINLGFFESRGEMKDRKLPHSILSHIEKANRIGGDWSISKSGRIALAFLHGFFDGDGHYYGGSCGTVFSSSKPFLKHLKEIYNIDNTIREHFHKSVPNDSQVIYVKEMQVDDDGIKPSYHLTLGSELYKKMMRVNDNGLDRKRPSQEKKNLLIRFNY